MNTNLKEKIREVLLQRYDVDIDKAKCYFSTQNFAFIFPGESFMIRVSATQKKTRSEIMSELMWLDDLKQFKETVCEPNVSKLGNLLEEFEIDDRVSHYDVQFYQDIWEYEYEIDAQTGAVISFEKDDWF